MRTIPAIGPLRGLAALLVLLSHVGFWTGASSVDGAGRLLARGDAGVAVFFAISAYLLTRRACTGAEEPPGYLRRRAARILPAYWVCLAAVIIVVTSGLVGGDGAGSPAKVLAHLVLAQGFTQDTYRGFTQTWSLTTEATFYALVPLIGRWLRQCVAARRSPLPMLAAIGVLSLVLQAFSASSGRPGLGAVSTSVAGHALWFCVGIACAWLTDGPRRLEPRTTTEGERPNGATPPTYATAIGFGLVAFALAATPLAGPIDLSRPSLVSAFGKEALYAAFAAALLLAAVTAPPHAQQRYGTEVPRAMGDLSYGVFLWHVLVLDVLFAAIHLHLFAAPFVLVLIVTVVVSGFIAAGSWRFVERPAIARAHRRQP